MDVICLRIADYAAWAMAQRGCSADAVDYTSSIRAKPSELVVCTARRVYSCTPAVRQRGIVPGDPVERVRSMAPDACFILRDAAAEHAILDNTLARLYDLTPQICPMNEAVYGAGKDNSLWVFMQNADHQQLSAIAAAFGAQIGVASRRCWSMLAALHSDPGRATAVPAAKVTPFLRQAPVAMLEAVGFSRDLTERLELFGLKAIAHIRHLTRRQLSAQFGREGGSLFTFLNPTDTEPPVPHYELRVIDADYDFDWPVFEPGDLLSVIEHLLKRLIGHLRGRSARHMELRLKGRNHERVRRASRILKDPASRFPLLYNVAHTLLHQALEQKTSACSSVPCGRGVENVAIRLSGLTALPPVQTRLFAEKPGLEIFTEAVNVRFPGKLMRPVQTHANPFFPEEEFRFEPVSR